MRWVQGVTSRNPWIRHSDVRLVQGNALYYLAMHLELDRCAAWHGSVDAA